MKKTLTAMALVTSILPLSNTSNAENETDLPELNSDNNQIDVNDDSVIRVSKDSLSATVLKDNAYLIDESGNKVESLKVGDKLQILKKLSDEPFTKVQFNGKALFIANDSIDAKSVSSTSGIDFKLESFAKVVNVKSGDTLNARSTDSTSGKVLFTLKPNAGINVIERTKNGWYKIEYYGNYGYVNSNYVELINPIIPAKKFNGYAQALSKLSAKELPCSNSKSLFDIPVNAGVYTTEKVDNNWYKIKYYDKFGYVNAKDLKILSYEEPAKPNFTVTPLDNIWSKVVCNSSIEGKKYPSSDSSTICNLVNGAGVYITGETSNGWYEIKYYNDIVYVPKENVQQLTPKITVTDFKMNGIVYNLQQNSKLNVRKQANTTSAIIATLYNDDKVNVTGKTSNNWYRVDINDTEGYVPMDNIKEFVEESKPPVEEESKPGFTVSALDMYGIVYNVTSDDVLNVRETPYYDGKLITTLENDSKVKVTGLTSNGWYQVDIDGKTGYANKKYIKEYIPETTKYKVINSNINLRTSPYWSGDIYETVNVGTVLDVIEINGDWATIYKDKKTLYAPANYLESLDNPPTVEPTPPVVEPNPPVEEESKPSFTVSALEMDGVVYNIASNDVLNVRETPYYDGNLITTLKNNTRVKVIGLTSNGWYQVEIDGKTGYANKNYIKEYIPQTTKYKVINGAINLRTSASWSGDIYETVAVGTVLDVIEINGSWATIYKDKKTLYAPANYLTTLNQDSGSNDSSSNVTTPEGNTVYTKYSYSLDEYVKVQYDKNPKYSKSEYENYINPLKCNKFEFLRIDTFRNLDVNKLNSMLSSQNAGVLIGKGQAFLDTARKYNIDPLYFIAQSLHETGYGKSTLAKGVTITEIADVDRPIKDSNGNITGYVMIPLESPTTVYNLYGIGAQDNLPTMPNRTLILGTTHAYKQGWTSVEKAIDGAGQFVSSNYIHSSKYKQNTLYKFRFNPSSTYIWHQYATTPWYSRDIAKFIDKYQDFYIDKDFTFDKPLFTNMSEYSLSSVRSANIEEYCLLGKEDITLK